VTRAFWSINGERRSCERNKALGYTEELLLRQVRGELHRKRQTDKGRDREMEAETTDRERQQEKRMFTRSYGFSHKQVKSHRDHFCAFHGDTLGTGHA